MTSSLHAASTDAVLADNKSDTTFLDRFSHLKNDVITQMRHRIIGQELIIEQLLITLLCNGHALLVGVPGLAKTRLIQTLAEVIALDFNRVQFTPDLMPSDITGTDVIQTRTDGSRVFEFSPGPIFTNLLLADEINRTPPKTQAALLQAMQETQVTMGGNTHNIDAPLCVFATQNPIEQEGTYPLPEAQLDRFMLMLQIGYPSEEEELAIIQKTTSPNIGAPTPVLNRDAILDIQQFIPRIPISESLTRQAVTIVRATRPAESSSRLVRDFVSFGAGPRAAQHLVMAAKARAFLSGRPTVETNDLEALLLPCLRHRLSLNFQSNLQGIKADEILSDLLTSIPHG
ncbi:MAG: MoxR family ATPase [Myxococcota bacterium]|nr:MoxR family ATPase [Myxococcota bacterium]